ncbi:MAG: C4-dicarboxylic acid transporter DauA [Acidobacteriota bacterium]
MPLNTEPIAAGSLPRPAIALRAAFRRGYSGEDLRADMLAGVVVGVVALPLSMALAIASGVPPQYGLYTAIVAGAVVAALGGSSVQVTGPTAAFVVLLAPVAARYGVAGLLLASMMAGVLLLAMGVARLGKVMEFVPMPVTTGFTAGIAIVIATLQLKDFLGLEVAKLPDHTLGRVAALAGALPSAHFADAAIGALTLALLLVWPKLSPRIPGALVALSLAAVVAHFVPGAQAATIGSRFSYVVAGVTHSGIPRLPPLPLLPWAFPGPHGEPLGLSFEVLRELAPAAFAIALLGAIESLLSAVVADGMAGTRHDPDAELLALGTGNILAPFFGGFAATGAIARTATNIRSGARSPIAAIVHSVFVLLAVLLLAPLLAYLPMASLAALLLLVAWNMGEPRHVLRMLRAAPKSDVLLLLLCLFLTVVFDMVVSVTVGVLVGALLFMRRMAEVSGGSVLAEHRLRSTLPLPKGVLVYQIAGPLFFGAARKAMEALQRWDKTVKVLVLDMSGVPALDVTGLVSLESALERLHRGGVTVVVAGAQGQPLRAVLKAGWRKRAGVELFTSFEAALERARTLV